MNADWPTEPTNHNPQRSAVSSLNSKWSRSHSYTQLPHNTLNALYSPPLPLLYLSPIILPATMTEPDAALNNFPQDPSDFDSDPRISFSKLDDKFILETDDGNEFEWDTALKRWIQTVRRLSPLYKHHLVRGRRLI